MYIPNWFREERTDVLHDLIRRFSFAALVGEREGRPFATHLPLLLDATRGPLGTLRAHLARPNPQGEMFGDGEHLVIFQGPHAYISPSWYRSFPNVPTWNYAVVHAYGVPRLLDEVATLAVLRDTVNAFESGFETPWTVDAIPDEYVHKLLCGLTAFEIEITRLEGKFKLSQNKPESDRQSAIAALNETGDADNAALASLMQTVSSVVERP